MATGTTNPMTYQTGTTPVPVHIHQVSDITGLSTHIERIQATGSLLEQVESLLKTCDNLLSASSYVTREEVILIEQYTADIQNIQAQLDSILKEDVEDGFNSLKENQVILQAAVAELQLKINTAYDAANAVMELYKVAEGNTAGELQKLNDAIVEIKKIINGDGTEEFPGLIPNDTINAEKLAELDGRLYQAEGKIKNLTTVSDAQASGLEQLNAVVKQYLPSADGDGEIKASIEDLEAKLPTTIEINKKSPVWKEVEGGDPFSNTTDYLDYTVDFKNNKGESKFSTDLLLTSDINTYLDQALKKLLDGEKILGLDSRLYYVEGCLSNVVQYVMHMASYHSFVIKDIGFYFVGGEGYLDYLPEPTDPIVNDTFDIQASFVNVVPDFPESARMDNKVFSPAELAGKNFYVIFKTSFPIDLNSNKVCLGFPNFKEGSSIKYAPDDNFKCARLGIPDLSYATYVLYADLNSETKKLTPFTFGSGAHVFGTSFSDTGTYKFMLKVTDPYNPNTTAELAKTITVGLPIYYGISEDDVLDDTSLTSGLTSGNFAQLHTDFNSPATMIDWSRYNDLIANANTKAEEDKYYYYYYVVPTALVEEGKTLQFNTGYGPGGWELQEGTITNGSRSYYVYRTEYALTYCPSTSITITVKKLS